MSAPFIVSARKYRPQRFDEVVGQEMTTQTLKNAIVNEHLAHSFLFCGPRGVGKTTIARILAKTINCKNLQPDHEACNSCDSCTSFNDNASFNIHELDAASKNSVDDIRALVEQVRYAPQNAKYKIFIIDEVHMLSSSAFNAFLKTLEEPPSYAKFILATTERHKILPTILSRCQIYDFKRISVQSIHHHLQAIADKEGIKAEPKALNIIAQKADGGLRDALSLFDRLVSLHDQSITYQDVIQNLNILDYDNYFEIAQKILDENHTDLFLILDNLLQRGFEVEVIVHGLAEHMRNLLIAKKDQTLGILDFSDDIIQKYLEQAKLFGDSTLLNHLQIVADTDAQFRSARNKRLIAELMLMKMCYINRMTTKSWTQVQEEKKNELTPSNSEGKVAPKDISPEPKKEPTEAKVAQKKLVSLEDIKATLSQSIQPEVAERKEYRPIGQPETAWKELLKKIENDPISYNTLCHYDPGIDQDPFVLYVENDLQFKLVSDLIPLLESTYYQHSGQYAQWRIEIDQTKAPEIKVMSKTDEFYKLSEKYPILESLRREFELDLYE
jgi:DNA polymerase-3 subunit gamma/tau